MENRSRLLVFVLIGVLAVLGGVAAGALLTGRDGTAAATASPEAQATDTPEPEESGTPPASASPSDAATPSAGASAGASPTAAPVPLATVTFTQLRLDAQDDPAGRDRVLRFDTGTGAITVELSSITPQGNTVFCLGTPTQQLGCRTAGSGRLSAQTTKPKETFLVTLRGEDVAQPIVEVTLTFPARDPAVTIENARFDGTDYPETNGIQAIVTPRSEGNVRVTAEWGGKPLPSEITLIEQGGPGGTSVQPDPGTGTDTVLPIAPPNPWKVVLQHIAPGFGVTPMTATVAWP